MKCTICNAKFENSGGENTKDHCCRNADCESWDFQYYPHLSLVPDWYFAEAYHLPFKFGDKIYAIIGPKLIWSTKSNRFCRKTTLQEIVMVERQWHSSYSFAPSNEPQYECKQNYICSIPYMALPANDDFNREFDKLKDKLIKVMILA